MGEAPGSPRCGSTMQMTVTVCDLLPGDYVILAKATVAGIDPFGCLVIIDFTDKTATSPILATSLVSIDRPLAKGGPV